VYVFAGLPQIADTLRRAALVWAGRGSALSHRSAGELWQLDGVRAERPEVVVLGTRHPRSAQVTVHRTQVLPPSDIARVSDLRVTNPTRTVIDLASVLDLSALRVAFESARRQRLTTVERVRERLDAVGGPGRKGAARLEVLLAALEGRAPSEFPLEVKVAEIIERSHLPRPVPQLKVRVAGRGYRLDFAWPAQKVALECDGRERHSEDTDFQRDRARWSDLAGDGWRLQYATWHDAMRRPAELVARLERALAA
jgi:hypothetical protein